MARKSKATQFAVLWEQPFPDEWKLKIPKNDRKKMRKLFFGKKLRRRKEGR